MRGLIALVVAGLLGLVRADASETFADDLEQCIRDHAAEAARTQPTWASVCLAPTEKIDMQAKIYERTLAPIYAKYGYNAALWCAFYSLRMTGKEFDPNSDQPNNPKCAPTRPTTSPVRPLCALVLLALSARAALACMSTALPTGTRASSARGSSTGAATSALARAATRAKASRPSGLPR